ncbi:MAG: hypothetical protein KJN90_11320 [Gammaproteobacteria bacterium]|nr:hypothetical protein [Gammaproteobacteria bacterium]
MLFFSLVVGLQACSEADPTFHPAENPLRLSDWNLLSIDNGELQINPATLRFQPRNTLFTDYAHKLRTMWVPVNEQVALVNDRFVYPVGTVLSKTFYYPTDGEGVFSQVADNSDLSSLSLAENRLIETRLLVRRQSGWEAFPYVWNDEQTEAFLRVAGTSQPVSLSGINGVSNFTYFVPNENQCSGCHTRIHPDGGLEPLGAVAHQLNYPLPEAGQQGTMLNAMVDKGWLSSAPSFEDIPHWQDESLSMALRAAAYLDMNCGHCHNPDGPADTSALLLDGFSRTAREMGFCKPPVAAGGGAGDRLYGIVPGEPDESILLYRMQSVEPDEMMPELGRALVHEEGLALIRDWISEMSGDCS